MKSKGFWMRIKSASFEPREMREALKRLESVEEKISRELPPQKKVEPAGRRPGFWARFRRWLLS